MWGARTLRQIVDHKLLLEATRCEDLGARLGWESDSADNVGVLQSVKAFSCVGVPDLATIQRVSCVSS